jgi:hypothetical protein
VSNRPQPRDQCQRRNHLHWSISICTAPKLPYIIPAEGLDFFEDEKNYCYLVQLNNSMLSVTKLHY